MKSARLEDRRHAPIVIGQAQPQGVQAEARQQAAEADVRVGVTVPLRQHHDRATPVLASSREARRREQARVDRVVLGVGRRDHARERHGSRAGPIAGGLGFPGIVVGRRRVEEPGRVGERRPRPVGQRHVGRRGRAMAVRAHPVESPLEGAHDAVVGAVEQAPFPGVEEAGEHQRAIVPERLRASGLKAQAQRLKAQGSGRDRLHGGAFLA